MMNINIDISNTLIGSYSLDANCSKVQIIFSGIPEEWQGNRIYAAFVQDNLLPTVEVINNAVSVPQEIIANGTDFYVSVYSIAYGSNQVSEPSSPILITVKSVNSTEFDLIELIKSIISLEPKIDALEENKVDNDSFINQIDHFKYVINEKVDKVEGKGLSSNDFTDDYKTKVDGSEYLIGNTDNLLTYNTDTLVDAINEIYAKGITDLGTFEYETGADYFPEDNEEFIEAIDNATETGVYKFKLEEDDTGFFDAIMIVIGSDLDRVIQIMYTPYTLNLRINTTPIYRVRTYDEEIDDFVWSNWSNPIDEKVDKVEGKELSSNDFTDEYRQTVDENSQFIGELTHLNTDAQNTLVDAINEVYDMADTNTANIEHLSRQMGELPDKKWVENSVNTAKGETSEDINALNETVKVLKTNIRQERTRFWLNLTINETRLDYTNAFAHKEWNAETFNPSLCIKPKNAGKMFANANKGGASAITPNINEHIAQFGGSLDWSECINYNNCFNSCTWFKKINELDFRKVTEPVGMNNMAPWAGINQVGIMKFADDGSTPISTTMFYWWDNFGSDGTTSIEGTLGYSLNLSHCSKINVGTMKQLITHLANYLGTNKEATCTLTIPSSRWELLEASTSPYEDGLTDDANLTWRDYIQTSLGWLVA